MATVEAVAPRKPGAIFKWYDTHNEMIWNKKFAENEKKQADMYKRRSEKATSAEDIESETKAMNACLNLMWYYESKVREFAAELERIKQHNRSVLGKCDKCSELAFDRHDTVDHHAQYCENHSPLLNWKRF